jgi:hypothetical protein
MSGNSFTWLSFESVAKSVEFKTLYLTYGTVNFVKKHNYKLWLNDMFISKEELHVSAYSGHLQIVTIFC